LRGNRDDEPRRGDINWTTVRYDDPFSRGFEYVPFSAEIYKEAGSSGKVIKWRLIMDDKKDKCAHPPCTCNAVKDSKYCSAYCEGQAKTPAILCECHHPGCGS
jgi:hypothetical protein